MFISACTDPHDALFVDQKFVRKGTELRPLSVQTLINLYRKTALMILHLISAVLGEWPLWVRSSRRAPMPRLTEPPLATASQR